MNVTHPPRASARQVNRPQRPFPTAQCDALFAAVLVHDDLHPDAALPGTIRLEYTQEQLAACYRICLQLWQEGVDRAALREIIGKIGRERSLSAEEQVAHPLTASPPRPGDPMLSTQKFIVSNRV